MEKHMQSANGLHFEHMSILVLEISSCNDEIQAIIKLRRIFFVVVLFRPLPTNNRYRVTHFSGISVAKLIKAKTVTTVLMM